MFVNLEVRSGGDLIARKTSQRREGFFAFTGMKYKFSWPGRGVIATVREVGHNEEHDSFWLVFDHCQSMEEVITGQTDWDIFWTAETRKRMLQRPAQG